MMRRTKRIKKDHFLWHSFDFFKVIAERFIHDRFTYSASALTYTTLLSLVPFMAIIFIILSAFPMFHTVKDQVQDFVFSNFVPASTDVIKHYLSTFATQATKLSVIGIVFLAVTAIMMMLTIERALNDVWKVKEPRSGISAWLRYWAILSLGPIFIALSLTATTYVISLPLIQGAAESVGIKNFLLDILPILIGVVGFTLLYTVIPNCRVPWRYGFIGAVVAMVLFEIVKRMFLFYVTGFKTYELVYGALASIIIFLLWIYISWVIVLFGALVSNVLATRYFATKGGYLDGFSQAFLWIGALWQAQQKGASLSIAQLFRAVPAQYEVHPHAQLKKLTKANLIKVTRDGGYILARDLTHLSLAELYEVLPWRFPKDTHAFDRDPVLKKLCNQVNEQMSDLLNQPLEKIFQRFYQGN